MSNYIIECRNKDALVGNPNLPNGDFSTTIQDKITIGEGDTIMLKSAYIDTKATSEQKIVISEDLTVDMSWLRYILNIDGSTNMTSTSQRTIIDPSTLQPKIVSDPVVNDGLLYVQTKATAGQTHLRELKGIMFKIADSTKSQNYGGFFVFCNYTNEDGVKVSTKIQLPIFNLKTSGSSSSFYSFHAMFNSTHPLTITALAPDNNGTGTAGAGVILGDAATSASGKAPIYKNTQINFYETLGGFPNSNDWSTDISGVDHLNPIESSYSFDIPEGNYAPADLCELVNRELQRIGINGGISSHNLTANDFLVGLPSGNTDIFVHPVSTLTVNPIDIDLNNDYRYLINKAGTVNPYNGTYVGASQVVLAFEINTQRFFWEYIHSPVIAGNNEAIGYQTLTQNDGNSTTRAIDKYAGILFTNMSASNKSDGEPVEFWSKILGFDLEPKSPTCLTVNWTMELNTPSDAGSSGIGSRRMVFKPIIQRLDTGITITGGYQGIDTAFQKSDKYNYVPTLGQAGSAQGSFFSTSDRTNGIVAGDSVLSQDDKMTFGYYLIEVRSNFQNNYITEDENRRNVMAICSRYYVKDAYTSATSDDSLIYTHTGASALLSSFDIRILNSDKELADNIGQDNTIFLNVIKQPVLPQKRKD